MVFYPHWIRITSGIEAHFAVKSRYRVSYPKCYLDRLAQSVQRLATGWSVRGSNSCRGKIFRASLDRPWGPPSLLGNWYLVLPEAKAAGAWRLLPSPSSAEVTERKEQFLYSSFGPTWPVSGYTLPLRNSIILIFHQPMYACYVSLPHKLLIQLLIGFFEHISPFYDIWHL